MPVVLTKDRQVTTSSGGSLYDGSKTGSEFDRWYAQLADPESFIKETYDKLSSRNATLFNTSPFARAAVRKPISYIVGEGIYYQCLPNIEFLGMDRQFLLDWADRFTDLVHYDKLSFGHYQKQRLLLQDASITGDSCLWFDRDEDGYIVDLIATGGHIIDSTYNDASQNITMGIKTDAQARREGLFLRGDTNLQSFQYENGTQRVIQVFMGRERASQIRGYGVNQAIIALLKNSDTVWDTTIQRMVFESVLFAKTTSSNVDMQRQLDNLGKRTVGKATVRLKSGTSSGPTVSQTNIPVGSILNADEKGGMEFNSLETPSANFRSAMELIQEHSAFNRGYAPEFLAGKYPTSYSAGQGAINDSMRVAKNERGDYTRSVEDVLHFNLAVDYMNSGELPIIPGFFDGGRRGKRIREALLGGKYLGPVPGFRNPLAEARADDILEKAGVLLKSDRIWKGGGSSDFKAYLTEHSAQQQYFESLPYKEQERIIMEEQE